VDYGILSPVRMPASGAAEATKQGIKAIKHLLLHESKSRELPLSLARSD